MAANWRNLAQLVKIPPEAWDAVVPRGPANGRLVTRLDAARPGGAVSLNPQPLPPLEAAVGAQLLETVLTSAIIVVGGRGTEEAASRIRTEIEDWVGAGWPGWLPRPTPPRGWDEGMVFAGAALAAANLAAQYDHAPAIQEALGAASDQLLEQALGR